MSSLTKRNSDRARGLAREGAGGEPLGESPATPSEILGYMPDDIRKQLSDDVVDALLGRGRRRRRRSSARAGYSASLGRIAGFSPHPIIRIPHPWVWRRPARQGST
jgi:hypothetical protein